MSWLRIGAVVPAFLCSVTIAWLTAAADPESVPVRQIGGIYPDLTTYGVYSQNGAHWKQGHNECGIGAVVPWAARLWMVNYAPHMPHGSEHKLYSIDENLNLAIHPESVGGTPAARMIHRESNQLLIGLYLIGASGKVRVISPKIMPGRMTAIARHLTDPANMVYYFDMEGMIYEANVHGTFYEVPLITNGRPPAFHLMRPVASHAKQITDFCSRNGLLVLAGVRADAVADGHVFINAEHETALWFGGVDDLWKLGKPVGRGGPWKETAVTAGRPSEPYLMTGYDRKTLTLRADRDVAVTVEVDFDHQSGWHTYRTFRLTADQPTTHVFPEGFSAHWLRTTADTACRATAWLVYE